MTFHRNTNCPTFGGGSDLHFLIDQIQISVVMQIYATLMFIKIIVIIINSHLKNLAEVIQ